MKIRTVFSLLLPLVFYELCMEAAAGLCRMSGVENGLLVTGTGAILALPFLFFAYRKKAGSGSLRRKHLFPACLFSVFAGAGACLCFNVVLQVLLPPSKGWESAQETIYKVPMLARLLVTVLLAPLAEELVFRGWFGLELKRYMKPLPAALLSAVLFGIYHGNLTQGLYAFFLGLCLEWVCFWSESLLPAICLHVGANAASAVFSAFGAKGQLVLQSKFALFFAAVGALVTVISLYKTKEVFGNL